MSHKSHDGHTKSHDVLVVVRVPFIPNSPICIEHILEGLYNTWILQNNEHVSVNALGSLVVRAKRAPGREVTRTPVSYQTKKEVCYAKANEKSQHFALCSSV